MTDALVVFASRHGSTREVAETMTAILRELGAEVECRPAASVREPVRDRDLVVLGGALYSGRWHRDAYRFLKRHRHELAGMPVAVFAMGPRSGDPQAWRRSRAQLDRALARRAWLHPIAIAVFGGVDPTARRDRPRRDLRDWDAIQHWTRLTVAGRSSVQTNSRTG